MKIQFIVVGWHFNNFKEFIEELKLFKNLNSDIDIFWSCHKEPTDSIKTSFDYKVFPNLGLEDGAYQQALDFLNIPDDTILFLLHDDMLIKDWNFVNICLEKLNEGYKFIGNGKNYPAYLDPTEVINGKEILHHVKPESKKFFTGPKNVLTIRESFICTVRKYLKDINDFEVIWEEPKPDSDGNFHIGGIGNLQQSLLGYKITTFHSPNSIYYLSDNYQDSDYIYEFARGKKV